MRKKVVSFVLIFMILILSSCTSDSKDGIISCLNSTLEVSIVDESTGDITTKGTAFCYKSGYLLSAKHIFEEYDLENDEIIGETIDGQKVELELLIVSTISDLAILKLSDIDLPVIQISEKQPYWLDEVFFIGNTRGLGLSINKCYVSSPNKQITINNNFFDTVQINGTINEGDSGGPLLNNNGELIGVISFKLTSNSGYSISDVSFAVSLNTINDFLLNEANLN